MEVDTTKFDTCRYRTDVEIPFGELGCCGVLPQSGFCCLERMLEGLTPIVCMKCDFYEKRFQCDDAKESE